MTNARTRRTPRTLSLRPVTISKRNKMMVMMMMDVSQVPYHLDTMKQQEKSTYYQCMDYLGGIAIASSSTTNSTKSFSDSFVTDPVDYNCRLAMCEWCYNIVDYCNLNRETVAYGISYLDRYLCTSMGTKCLMDRRIYQLVVMTCLYIAIKVHETVHINTKVLANLSGGLFVEKQFEEMERTILHALQWRLNGPTSLGFIYCFVVTLLPSSIDTTVMVAILQHAQYQAELSVLDYNTFVKYKPSEIALAAIANSLLEIDTDCIPMETKYDFLCTVAKTNDLMIGNMKVLQNRLCTLLLAAEDRKMKKIISDESSI